MAVNSSTKVTNLNADLLDGSDSSAFQKSITGQCANRTAIAAVNADGTVSCASSAVYPIYQSLSLGSQSSDAFASSGLSLNSQCNALSSVGFVFGNAGANASTLNWMFSKGGSASTVNVGGEVIGAGATSGFGFPSDRLAGQFIWTTTTGLRPFITRYVVTLNIHQFNSGTGCVFTGTAEVATTSIKRS